MANDDEIAAAIAKVKSQKTKKSKLSSGGDLKSSGGKPRASTGSAGLLRAANGGTAKKSLQGASLRTSIVHPGAPVIQQRAAAPKARVVPIGQKLKYVFDLAKCKRTPLRYEVFKAEKEVDIEGPLLEALRKHTYLRVDEIACTITYQPKYAIHSQDEILRLVRSHPFGLLSTELADAYPEARQHLDELCQDGVVFECGSTEKPSSIVYPNLFRPPSGLPDDNVRDALFYVELPQREDEIAEALKAARITKAKRSTPRLKMAIINDDSKPIKEKKQRKLRKVTNTHMEHLFNDDMPAAIDG